MFDDMKRFVKNSNNTSEDSKSIESSDNGNDHLVFEGYGAPVTIPNKEELDAMSDEEYQKHLQDLDGYFWRMYSHLHYRDQLDRQRLIQYLNAFDMNDTFRYRELKASTEQYGYDTLLPAEREFMERYERKKEDEGNHIPIV
jgi:hypothetical protein